MSCASATSWTGDRPDSTSPGKAGCAPSGAGGRAIWADIGRRVRAAPAGGPPPAWDDHGRLICLAPALAGSPLPPLLPPPPPAGFILPAPAASCAGCRARRARGRACGAPGPRRCLPRGARPLCPPAPGGQPAVFPHLRRPRGSWPSIPIVLILQGSLCPPRS